MIRFILRRLFGAVVVLLVVSVVTFATFQLAPLLSHTSPVYYYIGKIPYPPGSVQLNALEHRFGFDLPLPQQYWVWLHGILFGRTLDNGTGDVVRCAAPCLGYSFRLNTPVTTLIARAFPVSLSITIGAAILWLVGGVAIGTVSALQRGKLVDRVGMTVALAGVSLPIFFTGPILLLIFEFTLKWLPDVSYGDIIGDPAQWLRSMLLPWMALAFGSAALYARLTRANMLETMGEDFIRTARAKGVSRGAIVVKHGMRAALTPIVTIFGMDIGTLVGGMVITETVFNLRGVGYLSIQAIQQQDLPIIMGVTIVASMGVVLANLMVDILYAVVDPRVSYS